MKQKICQKQNLKPQIKFVTILIFRFNSM